jgi:putative ABC transport system substrate-binding protein
MVSVEDPIGTGLVTSLAHPIGNITGVTDCALDLVPKRLEFLKAALPDASRIAFFRCLRCAAPSEAKKEVERKNNWTMAARDLRLTLVEVDLSGPQDLENATRAAVRAHPDALFLDYSPIHFILRKELAAFAMRERLPMFALLREQVAAGGLLSYGPSVSDQFRKAAIYVDRILKGAKPADLPIEQPTKLALVVNLKTAKALGLTIPPSLLLRADEVIQ